MKYKLKVILVILFTFFIAYVFTLKPSSLFFDDVVGSRYSLISSIKMEGSSEYINVDNFINERLGYVYYKKNNAKVTNTIVYNFFDESGQLLFKYIKTNKEDIVGFDIDGEIVYYDMAE